MVSCWKQDFVDRAAEIFKKGAQEFEKDLAKWKSTS